MSRPTLLTRRQLVAAGTTLTAAAYVPPAWGRLLGQKAFVGPGTFTDGVASGEPAPDAMTFWSRLTTERASSGAMLIVAEDEGLTRTVATVVVPTGQAIDGALKTRVTGLQPERFYFYVWKSADDTSPVGRTKTAPAPDADVPLDIAFSSCQRFPVGFFNAHHDAAPSALDLYVFLGDYTYEYGPVDSSVAGRSDPAPSVDLASYRAKNRMYRADKDLRELHRLHPTVHIWDDHEVADNYSDNDPRPSDLQRTAGYRASFEWQPRMVMPSDRFRIYKPQPLGRQVEVILLDQRQYRTGDNDGAAEKHMIGRTQLDWLKGRLAQSPARWKLVASQAMFAPLQAGGQPINTDQWDGYPAERQELLDHIATSKVSDVVLLTGDIHTYMANQLLRNASSGPSIATEYIGGSVSSSGFPGASGLTQTAIATNNPWIKLFNGDDHGYARMRVTAEKLVTDYRVAPLDVADAPSRSLATFDQPLGANDFTQTGGSSTPAAPAPPARSDASYRAADAPNAALGRRRRAYEQEVARQVRRAERATSKRRSGR